MKVLFVGLGSIGCRHLRNLRALAPDLRISALRSTDRALPAEIRSELEVEFHCLNDAVAWCPNGVLICTPAPTHIDLALAFAAAGIHIFVEKPLAAEVDGIEELIELCKDRGSRLMIGYPLRFHGAFRAVQSALQDRLIGRVLAIRAECGQYLPDWRPSQDYRKSVSASKDLGGGVLLELSHEIDYVLNIGESWDQVIAATGQIGNLEIDVEDLAEVILHLKNGAVGSVHLNMLQRTPSRSCKIIGTEGTIVLDFLAGSAILDKANAELVSLFENDQESEQMFVDEMKSFLSMLQGEKPEGATGEEALDLLNCIAEIRNKSCVIGRKGCVS